MARGTDLGLVLFGFALAVGGAATSHAQQTSDLAATVRQLELRGESREARQLLERAVAGHPDNPETLFVYARFLDDHRDPKALTLYQRVAASSKASDKVRKASEKRLTHLKVLGAPSLADGKGPAATAAFSIIEIPGPLRSFARMAALSPDLMPDEVMTSLSRNVVTNGYQAVSGSESLEPTEYLKLTLRYLGQARELDHFAGPTHKIKIEACDSTQTGELIKILGFRMRGGCGSEVALETVNASRAFLSMDSGFPLAELEQALRTNQPFELDYSPSRVPVLYTPEYWLSSRDKRSSEVIDAFLGDPSLCRLYLGLVKLDPQTADEVRRALPVTRLRAFAHVFDFFGGMLRLRDGKVLVPGGAKAEPGWADLAGAQPSQGVPFVEKLMTKDDGWLASYFDALSRIEGPTQDYLCDPVRLKRFYTALRGRVTSPGPARPVFRANTDLMLLTSRLRVNADGQPHLPGDLEVWKSLFIKHPNGKYDGKLTKNAANWKTPDELLEGLYGLSRKSVENEPLKIFLALSDVDRLRKSPLKPSTVERLARDWRTFGAQYSLFSEVPELSDETIAKYMDIAEANAGMRDNVQKADQAAMVQALSQLWLVAYRQHLLPPDAADGALSAILQPFSQAKGNRDLFDCGRAGVTALLKAANLNSSADPQDGMLELVAGTTASVQDEETLDDMRNEMNRIFEAQRLVPLKTLFDLSDHLEAVAKGEKLNTAAINKLAARVSDMNLPKSGLSSAERNSFSFGYWTDRHIDFERKLNLRAMVDKAGAQPEKLRDVRGALAPVLRDTLVGLLYIHYAPPGAQVLFTNPLFVRSHDFIGIQNTQQTWRSTEVLGSGWPSSAGGRLVGSLATLPYALAEAEQNFLIPNREQALIWSDLVPQLIVSSKLPRWWNVTRSQTHWVALHLRAGEAVVAESATSPEVRTQMLAELDRSAPPVRVRRVGANLQAGQVREALEEITPSELYFLGAWATARKLDLGGLVDEINAMASADPTHLNPAAISDAFGTPKPTLSNSMRPALLNVRTFPTLMGYSSRILAESWESGNLFFAALADELSVRPSRLNILIPEWTRMTVEQIFATHLEDWPAVLRSMRVTADGVRTEARKQMATEEKASLE